MHPLQPAPNSGEELSDKADKSDAEVEVEAEAEVEAEVEVEVEPLQQRVMHLERPKD